MCFIFCASRIPRKKKVKCWILSERRTCLRFATANKPTDNSDFSPVDPPTSVRLCCALLRTLERARREAQKNPAPNNQETKLQAKVENATDKFSKKVQSLINRLDRSRPVHQRVGDRSLAGQRQRPAERKRLDVCPCFPLVIFSIRFLRFNA